MRGLFGWAYDAKLVAIDPSVGVKNPPRKSGPGFIPWTEEHVEKYRARWPVGTRQRVWMEVLLQTGLRRGDAVTFGRQHIRVVEGISVAVLNTERSNQSVPAIFPVTPELEKITAAGPCGDLTFICGASGRPFGKEVFGNEFRGACKAAGVPGSAHGLRKLASIRAAHKGVTTAQMRALFGWTTDAMPSLYTKAADRLRLALEGAAVMVNEKRNSIPSPRRRKSLTLKIQQEKQ
jgi:integrase